MTRLKARPDILWLLIVTLALSACEQEVNAPEHISAPASNPDQIVDEIGTEIRRIKDLLLDDQLADAERALDDLKRLRFSLPPERQIEIDRLDAVFVGAR